MNSNDLYNAIGAIDDEILRQSETVKKKTQWMRWGIAAACLCLLVGGGIFWKGQSQTTPRGLPMLSMQDIQEGMGFEGVLCYDVDEIANGNPWSEDMNISTLPVFENRAYHSAGVPVGLEENVVLERLKTACAALNLENIELEYEYEHYTGECISIAAKADDVTVTARTNGQIEVYFENGLLLPDQLHFTWYDTSRQEAEEVMEYFIQQYAELIGFKEPKVVLSGQYIIWDNSDSDTDDFTNIDARFERNYMLYEGADDDTDLLLNYKMRNVRFCPDDNGRLSRIWIDDALSCADKLGDYPIITAKEAYKYLLEGKYITSVPYEIEDETLIQKEELVYRSGPLDPLLMPYYRFYVKLPDMTHENGLSVFGAYYIPAVSPEYISNMSLWNGSIN